MQNWQQSLKYLSFADNIDIFLLLARKLHLQKVKAEAERTRDEKNPHWKAEAIEHRLTNRNPDKANAARG